MAKTHAMENTTRRNPMTLEKLEIKKVMKILSQLSEQISCLECCKYYMVPETASCQHTLCHLCWKNRRTCPYCAFPVNRESIKLNLPLKALTEHCQTLCDSLETLLNMKLDEYILNTSGEFGSENCPIKNVNEWLEGSQNCFSAPVNNSESLSQEVKHIVNQELSSSKVQIHTHTEMKKAPPINIIHKCTAQEDWDKIESVPENREIMTDKQNIIGPMDIETFDIHDNEYTLNHPRRSSRKKELKKCISNSETEDNLVNRNISKDSSSDTDKLHNISKQSWSNVKRMRKEFSKLNKKNRNKLNVSIEMCKNAKNSGNNFNVEVPVTIHKDIVEIDDNTPNVGNSDMLQPVLSEKINNPEGIVNTTVREDNISDKNKPTTLSNTYTDKAISQAIDDYILKEKNSVNIPEKELITLSKGTTSNINNYDFVQKNNKVQFFKKGVLYPNSGEHISKFNTSNFYIDTASEPDSDDIDISIKMGNTLTNIYIKQKKPDVRVKVNQDRAIQTSLGSNQIIQINSTCHSHEVNVNNTKINAEDKNNEGPLLINNSENKHKENVQSHTQKTISTKKNTASTDTTTAHFEITESVENSLNNTKNKITSQTQPRLTPISTHSVADVEMVHNNDLDIFDSEAMKENNVVPLKDSEYASSEILMPTIKTKLKSQKNADKREREIYSDDDVDDVQIPKKKMKVVTEKVNVNNNTPDIIKSNNIEDSDNYDALMNQVFANIDADINDIQQSQSNKDKSAYISPNIEIINSKNVANSQVIDSQKSNNTLCPYRYEQRDSENLFSMIDKHNNIREKNKKVLSLALETIEEILTPVIRHNLETSPECTLKATEDIKDGSDKCVFEDTPQKMQNLIKPKHKNDTIKGIEHQSRGSNKGDDKITVSLDKKENMLSSNETLESRRNSRNNTVIGIGNKKESLETPLTINKFVNHIMHKSTPVARKSLSFENQNIPDYRQPEPEETICPTAESVVKNTQEKEFMLKAFEKSPEITMNKSITMKKNDLLSNMRLCVAGSCLTSHELWKLKKLCIERKWVFVDKYDDDMTHLVVAVDEQNKCQRSVKYMRALAAGKWIVSFEWAEKCMIANKYVDESKYEVLDNTGEPGPKRSRISKRKLFEGITFFCMPPFSVLGINSLKELLIDAGGMVVNKAEEVQVTDSTEGPRLLLAEPENTQENKFTYLAMQLDIVPVNYEWVLNCLGNYSLGSIQDLLLCSSMILPKAISKWPSCLISCDVDI